jgi:hypothetical protein
MGLSADLHAVQYRKNIFPLQKSNTGRPSCSPSLNWLSYLGSLSHLKRRRLADQWRRGLLHWGRDLLDRRRDLFGRGRELLFWDWDLIDRRRDLFGQGRELLDWGWELLDRTKDLFGQGRELLDWGWDLLDRRRDLFGREWELLDWGWDLLTTNYMRLNTSQETNCCSTTQEISLLLWGLRVHYNDHKRRSFSPSWARWM